MIILLIFLTIILGIVIWGGITNWKLIIKKKEHFNDDIKVAILIITLNKKWIKNERWKGEREIWEKYADKNKNVDCYFLECDKKEYYTILKNDCKESNQPGIYQKTIQSLKNIEKDYDFYIRTNTRMFFIFDNLLKQLKSLKRNKPYLYSEYCIKGIGHDLTLPQYINWAPGNLFILNKKTKDLIVKKGFDKKYDSAKTPDDILSGQVLTDNGVKCEKDSDLTRFVYHWGHKKSFEENVKNIDNSGTSVIYLNKNFDSNLRKKISDYYYNQKKKEHFDKKFPDYVVCSTSNSPYQNWQCELLAYSFNKVKQGGKLIFLCSDDPNAKGKIFPEFKNSETLKYPDWMKDVKFPGGGFYGPANKYYSMKKWVETYPNLKDNQTVLFLDPDMVFINPIKIDIKKGELWGQNWYSMDGSGEILDKFTNKNRNIINNDFCFMYPIAMTIHDVKLIVDRFINLTNKIFKKYPKQEADMYGHIIAVAEAGLKVKLDNITWERPDDGKLYDIIHYTGECKDNKNNKIFFKQDYTSNTETKPWKRPCDINKAGNERDKALLSLIHEYIDQQ